MDGALKVVLLAALILLVSAKTSDTTHFPKELQVHIDKALINVRDTYKDHHVAFHSIIGEPRLMNSIYNVNLKLIVKECKKNTRSTDECVPQKLLKRRDDVRSTCRENFTGGNTLLLKDDQKMGRCTGCM
ncbi:cystatin-like protein isoform X2 [Tachysurus fulvidraco]|uniref:cystatin-like protein isoform X2 n=1 Tax=Tachysurus fulvidraco TaxID=1234273 RepID=UPI000F4F9326|nr:cystatin-like protein isoform X2 [Tachysurus fulvidraco]